MGPLDQMLGQSEAMASVREQAARLLTRYATRGTRLPPVLVQGETGTGKGLLASALHRAGPRASGRFVDVNCAAIPETLLEAELFGFERGAFTGARQSKPGLFHAAHGGTIFLDEVALLPEALQAKLLKAIEERTVRRLGATRGEAVDAWIVAAASDDLRAAVRARRFREDLYHRLAVVTLRLPPLRERGQDIERLAEHFLARACEDYALARKALGSAARTALRAYPWPGNVRELANVMERVALLTEADLVDADSLGLADATPNGPPPGGEAAAGAREAVIEAAAGAERARILEALTATTWNLSRAAARLGVPRNTLRYRMEKLGLAERGSPAEGRGRAAPGAAEPPAEGTRPGGSLRVRWEPRRVTLLAARLREDASSSPSEASRALDACLDKVRTFGGRVVDLGVRGVVGAFGLEPVEDAPRRAAHAAMAIVNALGRGRHAAPAEGAPAAAVAIHTDTLQVGHVGEDLSLDADGKHAALRILDALLARGEPLGALVSAATAPFLRRRFELRPAAAEGPGGAALRLAGPIEGERDAARFVGRGREVRLLLDAFARATEGQGQLVSIAGEPGIGKSRLVRELRRQLADGAAWLEGRALSFGAAMPFHPLIDLLRRAADIEDGDAEPTTIEKLERYVDRLGGGLASAFPFLRYLLAVDPGDRAVLDMDPNARRAGIVDALRRLVLAAAAREPVVLVVEDAHWMDRATEECLSLLADSLVPRPVLLLLTCRPGYRPPFGDRSFHSRLALGTLTAAESVQMARELLASDALPEALEALVVRKAEGNPFFVEELLHALQEVGAVKREGQGLVLAHPLDELVVPDTIQDVILARIGRLDDEPRRILEVASVIGKDVPFPLLAEIADLPEASLRQALKLLQAGEFLYETSVFPDLEHTFKHALTHEVAYGSLEPSARRSLHGRIVDATLRLHPDRVRDQVERLAHHAFKGEQWQRAVDYSRQAGARAFARSANREAVTSFEQALSALDRLPGSRETLEQAIDIRLARRSALLPLGEIRRILASLREAEALARSAGDRRRLAWVFTYMTTSLLFTGEPHEATRVGAEAMRIAADLDDLPLRVASRACAGHACREQGRYAEAIGLLAETIDALPGGLASERFGQASPPAVYARGIRAVCHAARGEFAEGTAVAGEAVRIAETADLPFSLILSSIVLGETALAQGDLDRAVPALERAMHLIRTRDIPMWFPWAAATLGYARVVSGRAAEGGALFDEALGRAVVIPFLFGHSLWVAWSAEARLLAGRADDARRAAVQALDLARKRGERGYEAWALRTLGRVEEDAGPAREALALATALGMRPLEAHCHLDLARALGRSGHRAESAEHLERAAALYRELSMPFWLGRAEAAARDVA